MSTAASGGRPVGTRGQTRHGRVTSPVGPMTSDENFRGQIDGRGTALKIKGASPASGTGVALSRRRLGRKAGPGWLRAKSSHLQPAASSVRPAPIAPYTCLLLTSRAPTWGARALLRLRRRLEKARGSVRAGGSPKQPLSQARYTRTRRRATSRTACFCEACLGTTNVSYSSIEKQDFKEMRSMMARNAIHRSASHFHLGMFCIGSTSVSSAFFSYVSMRPS